MGDSSSALLLVTLHCVSGVAFSSCLGKFFLFLLSRFGEFCLVHLLLKRNPGMFSQHFIECIFHFNSYEKHEKYNRFPQSERSVEHICVGLLLNDGLYGHVVFSYSKAFLVLCNYLCKKGETAQGDREGRTLNLTL